MLHEILDLIHPRTCLVCDDPIASGALCGTCDWSAPPPCASCRTGSALGHEWPCPWSSRQHPALARLDVPFRTLGAYEGSLRRLILDAKWKSQANAVRYLASRLATAIRDSGDHVGLTGWVAVPRSRTRRLLHGRSLAESLGLELGHALRLRRIPILSACAGKPQARRSGLDRRQPRTLFRIKKSGRLRFARPTLGWLGLTPQSPKTRALETQRPDQRRSRSVLLIDDVVTTGTTLAAAVQALAETHLTVGLACSLAVPG